MTNPMRSIRTLLPMTALIVAAFVTAGCGGSQPPPDTKESLEGGKAEMEQILTKEYGPGVVKKAAPKAAGKAK
jgi:hypothetical protein